MDEINAAVLRHLEEQPDHEGAVALWAMIWTSFRRDGERGVTELLDELLESPDADETADR
jgi:hypothetical protein